MMKDTKICILKDFVNAKDCFPQTSISGGVCYFLRSSTYDGTCEFTNTFNNKSTTVSRYLDEFPFLIRFNEAVSIARLVVNNSKIFLSEYVSSISPFGISTKIRGESISDSLHNIVLHSSQGISYIALSDLPKGQNMLDSFKVLLSQTSAEHAGEPSKDGSYRILTSSMKVVKPNEVCTHSYLVIGSFSKEEHAKNLLLYLKTKFVRFLVLLALSSIHISKATFSFVPMQDFSSQSDIDWSKRVSDIDQQLYRKYGLTEEEIEFVESMIKPME